MKPCSKNRKLIAALSVGALDSEQTLALREHMDRCEGCRGYWQELSNISEALAATGQDSSIEASEAFHRKVEERLQAARRGSAWESLIAWISGPQPMWRVALPAAAMVAIAWTGIVALRHPSSQPESQPVAIQPAPAEIPEDIAPTIANYRMVANHSLEKFSELLSKQGAKRLPPAPELTASSLELGSVPY